MTTYREACKAFDAVADKAQEPWPTVQQEDAAYDRLWRQIATLPAAVHGAVRRRYRDWHGSWRALGGLALEEIERAGLADDEVVLVHRATALIPVERIREALRVADIGRWCLRIDFDADPDGPPASPWTDIVHWDLRDGQTRTTDPQDIAQAIDHLSVLETKNFGDLLAGRDLPTVGDRILQIAIYGAIAYA